MKLIELEISNFLGIGHAKLDLSDKGLVAIQGENHDDTSAKSNGAGKSSFADAIFWCLYGETARGLTGDSVVNWKVCKDCQVTSIWEDSDGSRFTVTRWRKKTVNGKKAGVMLFHTIGPAGTSVDLTKGTDKLTQVEIDKAIGCEQDVFVAAVYAAQGKMPNLPAMTDGELKQIIEKASSVDVLVSAYRIARDKLNEAERKYDSWRLEHVRAERDVTDAKNRLEQIVRQRDGYDGRKKSEVDSLTQLLRDAVDRARQKQADVNSVDAVRVQAEVDKLDAKIQAVESERTEEDRLASIEREAITRHTSMNAHYNRAVSDARKQKEDLDNVTGRVGTPCGECGKAYEDHDIESAKHIASGRLRGLIARAQEIKSDLATLQEAVTDASRALQEYRIKRTDITATVDERKRLAEALALRIRAQDAVDTETATARRLRAQLDAKKAETNPFTSLAEGAERELKEAGIAYRESEELGVAVEKRVMVCKDVVKVYGPAGVRAHILDTVTPFLNDRTADYLGFMSDGNITATWSTLQLNAKGELVEKFAINVQKYGKGSFAALSGGEQRKVRLATALALQDLVASRATKPIELWIGDEIDDAMDEAGLERLMGVLEKKARERGTVCVISHNSLNDWIRDTALVTMKGELATISGCLEKV